MGMLPESRGKTNGAGKDILFSNREKRYNLNAVLELYARGQVPLIFPHS